MDGDPRTKTLALCAQCSNGHWLPDHRLLQEDGETFCNEDCREQRREWLKVKHAGPDEFPTVAAAYRRYQDERHARIMSEQDERRARLNAELAALNAAWEAR